MRACEAAGLLALLPAALPPAAAPPAAAFGTPVLVGAQNVTGTNVAHTSDSRGLDFWYPSISIATGIPGHVAMHVTLSPDGYLCPTPGHPYCSETVLTRDAGQTYSLVQRLAKPGWAPKGYVPTSGNFNGCKSEKTRKAARRRNCAV